MTSESTSMVTAAAVAEEINAELAVPFFAVNSMESSVPFYVDVLGFTITKRWIDDGKLRWCWLELGKVAFMLQERSASRPKEQQRVGPNSLQPFRAKALLLFRLFSFSDKKSCEIFPPRK